MLRRIKRELAFLMENVAVTGLGAFLCCAGGILLWVSGGSGWYFLHRTSGKTGLTAAFLLWLLAYGLTGAALVWIVLADRARLFRGNRAVAAFAAEAAAYLFMLIWYALFFCTPLRLFASLLLAISVILVGITIVVSKRTFFLLRVFLILTIWIELIFLCCGIMDSL